MFRHGVSETSKWKQIRRFLYENEGEEKGKRYHNIKKFILVANERIKLYNKSKF